MASRIPQDTAVAATRCAVIYPLYNKMVKQQKRLPEERLEEACGLARAIGLEIIFNQKVNLRAIRPSTYLGKGKVEELATAIQNHKVELVIVDTPLNPGQQRNLEKAWKCKVIDRTALILEIFGERARTKEGVLQVELAALEYQKTRLVRSWTHLERQRGGLGFVGGPGETQIEIDRRLINDRIAKIKKQLQKVSRTRGLHRHARQAVPYPIVALAGYTNAGKSTLFNRLTGAQVMEADMLFATLDPTMRQVSLPSGQRVILSDTVGFISDLPTELVAAFRATLEEVVAADLVLHVRDVAHRDTAAQKADVLAILEMLGVTAPIIEVRNKIDLLEEAPAVEKDVIPVSAQTGEGCDALLEAIDDALAGWKQDHAHIS